MIGDNVTDKERIEHLETKVFELSQLVYALGAAAPHLPLELRNQFRRKHEIKKLEKLENDYEISPDLTSN